MFTLTEEEELTLPEKLVFADLLEQLVILSVRL